MRSRCGAGRQQSAGQRSDRQGAFTSTPWSPAGVAGNANPWRSLLRCTWNVRTFRTGAAKPNYPVRVLASTTEVPVCTGPCSRGAQLPAAVDTCNIRGVVCSTWLRRSALLGIYACLCGGLDVWYSIGPDCRMQRAWGTQVSDPSPMRWFALTYEVGGANRLIGYALGTVRCCKAEIATLQTGCWRPTRSFQKRCHLLTASIRQVRALGVPLNLLIR